MQITEELKILKDDSYKEFQSKIVPNVEKDKILGIRVPKIRVLAHKYANTEVGQKFIDSLPHLYYDENMLHALMINEIKYFDIALERIEKFLPYIDNWAVNDAIKPKCFAKHKDELIENIKKWVASGKTYSIRFGISMLMTYFLDEDFRPEYLKIPQTVVSDEYYVNMMVAWFFATALAKKWDETIGYIAERKLPVWVHKKTIQKAVESYRITEEKKAILKKLK